MMNYGYDDSAAKAANEMMDRIAQLEAELAEKTAMLEAANRALRALGIEPPGHSVGPCVVKMPPEFYGG